MGGRLTNLNNTAEHCVSMFSLALTSVQLSLIPERRSFFHEAGSRSERWARSLQPALIENGLCHLGSARSIRATLGEPSVMESTSASNLPRFMCSRINHIQRVGAAQTVNSAGGKRRRGGSGSDENERLSFQDVVVGYRPLQAVLT